MGEGSYGVESVVMSTPRWTELITLLVLLTTTVSLASPHTRYCGRKLTKVLLDLCGYVNSPTTDQLETGRRLAGDLGIVHHCCRKPCDAAFMKRYCAKIIVYETRAYKNKWHRRKFKIQFFVTKPTTAVLASVLSRNKDPVV